MAASVQPTPVATSRNILHWLAKGTSARTGAPGYTAMITPTGWSNRSPIEQMIYSVAKCTVCGAAMGRCDCWTKCKCGWLYEKGTQCSNPAHDDTAKMKRPQKTLASRPGPVHSDERLKLNECIAFNPFIVKFEPPRSGRFYVRAAGSLFRRVA